MIAERVEHEYSTKKVVKRKIKESSSLRCTPRRPKSAATFREVEQTLRSPGYLLPHDLHVSHSLE